MSKWLFVMVCSSFLLVSGCSRTVEAGDAVGSYIANHGKGTDTLEIKADGTYSHSYKSSLEGVDTAFSHTGKWELEQGNKRIILKQFVEGWPRWPGAEVDLIPRNFNTVVKKSLFFGKVRILINADSNYYYEKQES